MALDQMGVANVPQRYVLPPTQRPNPSLIFQPSTGLPVINHGVPLPVINDALNSAMLFFNWSNKEKIFLASDNVHEPVRYGTSLNHVKDKVHFWRDFIKHYSHPIPTWIDLWPSNPPSYKENMGNYVQVLHKQLMEVVFESLGLNPNYLHKDIKQGSQVMAINCYPACPEPDLTLGMPPHSDYGYLTILHQSLLGLQIMDHDKNWHSVPVIEGALIIQLGDQMEVMSNGRYKSVVHRVTVNSEKRRLSMTSLHSLALEKKVEPAPELVDEKQPLFYNVCSFKDFLDFISGNDIMDGRFIDTLKKNP
ncbi:unnamed protein product [Ilex paraguariensis]|uniref:Fe2OG dioxygenase domain-containing protein n=1 Tax=Ilex paraguariensis TaxID=185542 RepID=A0ABC8RXK5_9AQUA